MRQEKTANRFAVFADWLREMDLNHRPPGYGPDELPGCSIPRDSFSSARLLYSSFPISSTASFNDVAVLRPNLEGVIAIEKK